MKFCFGADRRKVRTIRICAGDGSTVRLAPQSAIAIDYSGQQRRIRLLAGEAFFSVQHDSGRPFVVTAGTVSTTDIGTAFDVRRQPETVRVAVSEGRVKVEDQAFPQSRAEIGASETVEVGMGGMRHGAILPDHVAAWGRGLLVADEEPMAEVVDRLRPWLKARVIMASRQSQRHITGVYNLAYPENALSAIAQAQGAEIYHFSPWLIVIR
ncbi:MAG: FecR domain-containing protein [Acetobacter malorum]|uniref:FecR family protein n=1 Tax=Acetobacter malorum TaxID=178901 RepID=UPI0039E8F224